MSTDGRLRLIALAARQAGLATLRGLSAQADRIRLCAIYTHRLRPKSDGPARAERPEFPAYAELADQLVVPLHVVDTPAHAHRLASLEAYCPFDILLSVSWRYKVPTHVLRRSEIAAINLHRGKLPEYAGAEPVRRALEAGDTLLTLTAHVMTDEIDAGPVLIEKTHPVGALHGPTLSNDVERIKSELCPLYPEVAMEAIKRVSEGALEPSATIGR